MPSELRQTPRMKQTPLQIVSGNLRALMIHAGMTTPDGEPNQSAMKRRSGVDQRTIGRVLSLEMNPTIEKVEQLASAFGLHAWQMLIPNLDPRNPPVVVMSEAERQFYRKLDELRTAEPPSPKYRTN